ncbi:MAG: aldehyde dehydrogenase, partial [Methanomicrobiales archaeon]|nr:aldehyde dehydrogenase [Methanomicrobiales archaeon]
MDSYPVLIGGIKKQTSETIPVRFPYTGEVYAEVCAAGKGELDTAVTAACSGYQKTRVMTSHERSQILLQLA